MQKTNNSKVFFPDYLSKSVLDLDSNQLKKIGITHLVFDIDETVVPRKHNDLSAEYIEFLQNLEKKGFTLLIGSNATRDISNITRHLNAKTVMPTRFSFKPLGSYYKKIIEATGTKPKHIAMIGDKVLNDIIGGNSAGLTTILVEPYAQKITGSHKIYLEAASRKFKQNK